MYKGYFRDNHDDSLYTVKIGDKGNVTELTLSGTPFTTTMDNSDDILYKPVKYTGATVEAITDDILYDIYNIDSRGVPVILSKGDLILWTGYNTPNAYDLGFEKKREVIQIECIDGLSTLQYFPYRLSDKEIRSFWYIINKLIQECKCYKYFYVSNNVLLNKDNAEDILKSLYISEGNFFGEKQSDLTDDDVAWKCNEVLEEICKYLGYTCTAIGDSVWFIDYDAIKKGINTYYRYTVGSDSGGLVTMDYSKAITGSDYSKNGATVSLDSVYNKITVTASLNDGNDLSDIFDLNLKNITGIKDSLIDAGTAAYRTVQALITPTGDSGVIEVTTNSRWNGGYTDKYDFIANKYYIGKDGSIKTHLYTWDLDKWNKDYKLDEQDTPDTWNLEEFYHNHYGCILLLNLAQTIDKEIGEYYRNPNLTAEEFTKAVSSDISSLSFTDTIMFIVRGRTDNVPIFYATNNSNGINAYYNRWYKSLPMFDITYPLSTPVGGKNAYIVISGDVILSANRNEPYVIPDFTYPHADSYRSTVWKNRCYIWCQLNIGNRWWNGNNWSPVESDFKLYFMEKDTKAVNVAYKEQSIRNNISWWMGIDGKGTAIPVPEDILLAGEMKFTMYTPMQLYDDAFEASMQQDMRSFYIWLTNFKIQAVIGDPTFSNSNDTDTEYSAVINEQSVTELDDIEFKVNTWDNKKPNYSCVLSKDKNKYSYVDTLYNKALSDEVKGSTFTDSDGHEAISDGTLRSEWWMVYKLLKQYNAPSVKLNLNLRNDLQLYGLYTCHNMDGKQFIVDNISNDYRYWSSEITLIEKK